MVMVLAGGSSALAAGFTAGFACVDELAPFDFGAGSSFALPFGAGSFAAALAGAFDVAAALAGALAAALGFGGSSSSSSSSSSQDAAAFFLSGTSGPSQSS